MAVSQACSAVTTCTRSGSSARARDLARDEAQALEAEALRPLGGRVRELGARLDREQFAAAGGAHAQRVQQEAEVALARAAVDDRRLLVARVDVVERGPEQADQVADLLQLAARVGVEVAVAREQVQVVQQRERNALGHFTRDALARDFLARPRHSGS